MPEFIHTQAERGWVSPNCKGTEKSRHGVKGMETLFLKITANKLVISCPVNALYKDKE